MATYTIQDLFTASDFTKAMNLDTDYSFIPLQGNGLTIDEVKETVDNDEIFQGLQLLEFLPENNLMYTTEGVIQEGRLQFYFISKSSVDCITKQNDYVKTISTTIGLSEKGYDYELNSTSGLIIFRFFPEGNLPQIADKWGSRYWAASPVFRFAARREIL